MTAQVFFRRAACLTAAAGLFVLSASAQETVRSRTGAAGERMPALGAYFPLAPGHTWVYRFDGAGAGDTVTVETGEVVVRGAHRYVEVRGFAAQTVWLRTDAEGRLLRYLPETGGEALWYDFSTPVGGGWRPEERDPCTGAAQVRATGEKIETPAGTFERTFAVEYGPGPCADAGIAGEVFAYGVGLTRRTIGTIAGPRSLSLVRTSIVQSAPSPIEVHGFSVSLEIDRPIYTPNRMPVVTAERAIPRMRAKFSVVNVSRTPVKLTFPSGQIFDFAIRTARGERVYTWSADKMFPAVVTEIEIGRRVFSVEVPLTRDGSTPLPPGLYVAEAWMVAPEGQPYKASAAFEVTEPAF